MINGKNLQNTLLVIYFSVFIQLSACVENNFISNRIDTDELIENVPTNTSEHHHPGHFNIKSSEHNSTNSRQSGVINSFLDEYRKLRGKKSEETMRSLATIGLISGTLKIEEAMKNNLKNLSTELLSKFNVSTPKENMEKLMAIEETIERDKCSIGVLSSVLEFARNANLDAFQKDMKRILKEVTKFPQVNFNRILCVYTYIIVILL